MYIISSDFFFFFLLISEPRTEIWDGRRTDRPGRCLKSDARALYTIRLTPGKTVTVTGRGTDASLGHVRTVRRLKRYCYGTKLSRRRRRLRLPVVVLANFAGQSCQRRGGRTWNACFHYNNNDGHNRDIWIIEIIKIKFLNNRLSKKA